MFNFFSNIPQVVAKSSYLPPMYSSTKSLLQKSIGLSTIQQDFETLHNLSAKKKETKQSKPQKIMLDSTMKNIHKVMQKK